MNARQKAKHYKRQIEALKRLIALMDKPIEPVTRYPHKIQKIAAEMAIDSFYLEHGLMEMTGNMPTLAYDNLAALLGKEIIKHATITRSDDFNRPGEQAFRATVEIVDHGKSGLR